jgi:flagellar biosynthesis protein FlhG
MDQALGLRKKHPDVRDRNGADSAGLSLLKRPVRVMSISSGKGGVGKSNVVVNLALAFDRLNKKVLIMDADLGLANVDVLLGLAPVYNISHVLAGTKRLADVLVGGPGRIQIMPSTSGVQQLTQLTDEQKLLLLDMLDDIEDDLDILIIDTGAGISDTVLYFNLAAQEKIVVVTPEPTSLTDAYALVKVLYTRHGERNFKILANSVEDDREGRAVFGKISRVADHFLDGLSLDYIGCIPRDSSVPQAVRQQKALLDAYPGSPAARAFVEVAKRLDRQQPPTDRGTIQFFWKRLLKL